MYVHNFLRKVHEEGAVADDGQKNNGLIGSLKQYVFSYSPKPFYYNIGGDNYNLDEIKKLTPTSLYIGDYKTFVSEQKGDIAFYLQKNRVRLIIDKVAFKRSSPKLSSQISTLRNVVEVTP